jgi:hypothetical protein
VKYLGKSLVLSASIFVWCASAQAATPDQALPAFVGGGLRQLVNAWETADPRLSQQLKVHITAANGDPLVFIHLADGVDAAKAMPSLKALGFRLQTVSSINPSMIEGFLPLSATRNVASTSVVRSMHAVQRPARHVGSVPSEAVPFEKADLAQARGIDGTGIRLGALSDSFDTCTACSTHAAQDVATGDLPVVTVVQDFPDGTDEGRAMLQLAHKIAPGASLLFATADVGELSFAENIIALRELFHSDIVVDDVIYFDEPMYSDGLVAQAVDIVKKDGGAYFSSAGNNGLEAYEAVYEPISFAKAQKMEAEGKTNLKLEQIPADIRPDTLHNFRNIDGSASITQTFTTAGDNIIAFQWDEPFNLGKVQTNYNIYVFDVNGNWMDPNSAAFPGFYTTDDNLQTDEPFEFVELPPFAGEIHGGANVSDYQLVIGKVGDGPARHIKYVNVNGLGVSQREGAPSTWGHGAARGATSVAAVDWAVPNFPEDFSSPGPVTIYLDENGNRLREPEVRFKPELAAADGISTTFFGTFFGTSAAAPDAAAVGALALQAAGGSGHLKPAKMYDILQDSATRMPLPIDRNWSATIAGPVAFLAQNDWVRWSRYFNIAVLPTGKHSVASITFDTTAIGLTFSQNPNRFNVGNTIGIAATDITASPVTNLSVFTVNFKPGSLKGGDAFTFGMSVFNPIEGSTEEDPDRFRGMLVTTTLDNGASFTSRVVAGFPLPVNNFTGFGVVNAELATIKAAKHK